MPRIEHEVKMAKPAIPTTIPERRSQPDFPNPLRTRRPVRTTPPLQPEYVPAKVPQLPVPAKR